MPELKAFTTTQLSRETRDVLTHARHEGGALVRDGEDGVLYRVAVARTELDAADLTYYLDALLPLALRGAKSDDPADYPGISWVADLPEPSRDEFRTGALRRLLKAVDGGGFSDLADWLEEWKLEAKLERAGVLAEMRKPLEERDLPEAAPRPRRRATS